MRILISSTIFLFLFIGCSDFNLTKNKKLPKKELISYANNGDIKAMLALNKYYNYPETKEGLKYYKKWYKQINNKSNANDIFAFSQVFYKYRFMFINGNEKYLELLEIAKNKGNIDALLYLYYSNAYKYLKKQKLIEEIEKKVSKEKLENAYFKYKEKNYNTLANDIKNIMLKKNYTYKKFDIKELNKSLYKAKLDKNYFNELLASDDLINIYETANLFMHKTRIYKKEASQLYKKVLTLTDEKTIKGKVYESLGYYNLNTLNNTEKAFKYFEKGIDLNNKDCASALLELLKKDNRYASKYIEIKQKLLQSYKGKKIYAEFLYKGFSAARKRSLKYFEELANLGDKKAIIILATRNFDMNKTNFEPEVYKLSKKWQDYILQSNDSELFQKMHLKLSGYLNTFAKEFQQKFIEKKEHSENIIILRDNFSKYRFKNFSKAILFAKKAISYGDKQSSMTLASTYRNKKKIDKAIEEYEYLSKKGDIEAKKELANLYFRGFYLDRKTKDISKAIKYYEEAAKLADTQATKKLAEIFLFGDYYESSKKFINVTKAIKYLKILEKKGVQQAWYYLGDAYSREGKNQDIKKALYYYEKTANSGYEDVYFNIAYLLYKHKELDSSLKKAVAYLKKATKYHDLAGANHLFGLFYLKGLGVEKDLKKAQYYFKNVESANPYKIQDLGFFYKDNKDYESALFCFRISAKRNFAESFEQLGDFYLKALGVKEDSVKALKYYKKAYKITQRDSIADKIANIYKEGKGNIQKDLKLARKWYMKSTTKEAIKELKNLK